LMIGLQIYCFISIQNLRNHVIYSLLAKIHPHQSKGNYLKNGVEFS